MLHHVDVHVSDIGPARALFDAIAPHIGYRKLSEEEPDFAGYETADGGRPRIGLILDREEKAGSMRLAFSVETRAQVDAAAQAAKEHATAIEGPGIHPEYGDYYAVFFEDADGNKFEIVALN